MRLVQSHVVLDGDVAAFSRELYHRPKPCCHLLGPGGATASLKADDPSRVARSTQDGDGAGRVGGTERGGNFGARENLLALANWTRDCCKLGRKFT